MLHLHRRSGLGRRVAVAAALLAAAGSVAGAGQRSFVSTSGVDNPTCSITSPCRGFNAAITATAPGGEVIVLDSGGYGQMTITKSLSIIAPPGVYAGISVSVGDGVSILTVPTDAVTLRGLTHQQRRHGRPRDLFQWCWAPICVRRHHHRFPLRGTSHEPSRTQRDRRGAIGDQQERRPGYLDRIRCGRRHQSRVGRSPCASQYRGDFHLQYALDDDPRIPSSPAMYKPESAFSRRWLDRTPKSRSSPRRLR